jgi:glycosyltransferase involved in cell wall biosynthesis
MILKLSTPIASSSEIYRKTAARCCSRSASDTDMVTSKKGARRILTFMSRTPASPHHHQCRDDALVYQHAGLQVGICIVDWLPVAAVNAHTLPLISIVTPSYNMDQYLTETIRSVLSQDYPHIEYIVVDGGSTDGTISILDRYHGQLRYRVGRDAGPSDAAHKGFLEAHGEIFAWLNADDLYLPGALRTAAEFMTSHPEVDVVYGEGWWIDERGHVIRRYPTAAFDPRLLARDCFICQPSAFIRAASYRRCSLDPTVNRSFDYDLWIRMAKQDFRFASIPVYLAKSRMHRGAMTIKERDDVFRASMALLKRHYDYVPLNWVFGYAAYCIDGRDQFFEPLRPSLRAYLASLPMGLRLKLYAGGREILSAEPLARKLLLVSCDLKFSAGGRDLLPPGPAARLKFLAPHQ